MNTNTTEKNTAIHLKSLYTIVKRWINQREWICVHQVTLVRRALLNIKPNQQHTNIFLDSYTLKPVTYPHHIQTHQCTTTIACIAILNSTVTILTLYTSIRPYIASYHQRDREQPTHLHTHTAASSRASKTQQQLQGNNCTHMHQNTLN